MKVLVAGSGAVGSWVGGLAALGGAEVTFVARGQHGEALRLHGLQLQAVGKQPWNADLGPCSVVDRVAGAAALAPFQLVLVAVKSYATADLAAELATLADHTPLPRVLCLQNGIGNEAILSAALPRSQILPGTITTGLSLPGPGTVEGSTKGGIGLALPADGGATDTQDLAALFHRSGHTTVRIYPDDGAAMKWSKLLLNLLGGATSAILGWPPAQVFADRRLFDLERAAWLEALAVMRAQGLSPTALPGHPVNAYATAVRLLPPALLHRLAWRPLAKARGNRLPGLAADLAAGRTASEVVVLNGAVVDAGAAFGISTPVNKALTQLVLGLATGKITRTDYLNHPAALLARIQQLTMQFAHN